MEMESQFLSRFWKERLVENNLIMLWKFLDRDDDDNNVDVDGNFCL